MNAREKLNIAYLNGSLLIAAVAGVLAGSWLVFGATFAMLVALNFWRQDIRPRK